MELHSIAVNGQIYELPSMEQFSNQLQTLAEVMTATGITAEQMIDTVLRMAETISYLTYHNDEIIAIKDNLNDLQVKTETLQNDLNCHKIVVGGEMNELRSALDAKNRKTKSKKRFRNF